jgi:aminoglycoside phosphotransferase family enzyme
MSEPTFYPHDVQGVEVRETHISLVFLTGGLVYKIKKPVALGFLDFRKLADRRRFCAREVELNRRLSSGVYEGVVAIRDDGKGGLSLAPRGRAVEYAVRMVQLPDRANLAAMLAEGPPTEGLLDDLGRTRAGVYAEARRSEDIDAFGDPELIRFNMEENFEQIAPLAAGLVPPEQWEFVRQVCRAFWKDHRELFMQRVQAGMIRDGHGDLRADHVYFHGGVQIIDCIEFNERFRYGDAALDLAI